MNGKQERILGILVGFSLGTMMHSFGYFTKVSVIIGITGFWICAIIFFKLVFYDFLKELKK